MFIELLGTCESFDVSLNSPTMAFGFKTEEEVKEYLENIGVEYKFSCFKERNAEGCHLLGDYLESVKSEFDAAAKIYKSNCEDLKYAKSCLKYGNYNYLGKGIEKNFLVALNYYKKACELDSSVGCLHTGIMLTKNTDENKDNSIEKNIVEGVKYLERSCLAGNAIACYYASGFYIKGDAGIPKDKIKAAEFSLRACDGGNIHACMNMSQMYRYGDGVDKDEKRANEFKERAKEIRDDIKKKRSIGLQQHI